MRLKGGPELMAFLEAFPKNLQKNALRAGLTAAARPIRDDARARIQRKSGKAAKSIKSSRPKMNSDGTMSVKVRMRGAHAQVGLWLEYGTAAHFIKAGDSGKSARLLTRQMNRSGTKQAEGGALLIGNNFVTGAVLHPGIAAHPFMRPALDAKAAEAVRAFGERVQTYMQSKANFTAPLLEVEDDE